MQNEIPEWAVTVAHETVVGTMAQASPLFVERVAHALVAAERRWIERAARFHDDQADQFEKAAFQELSVSRKMRNDDAAEQHRKVAAAIRQLGETT